MPPGHLKRIVALIFAVFAPAALSSADTGALGSSSVPAPPPATFGINVPEVRYYSSNVPFANLIMGSGWVDSRWAELGEQYQDRDGNILSLPPGGGALERFVPIPPTGPDGVEVRCTFKGSGRLGLAGSGRVLAAGGNALRFRAINQRGREGNRPYLTLVGVDPRRPFRDLDCREAGVPATARFRPGFLKTLHGYRVVRFMDWQNANANGAVAWAERHTPAGTRLDRDGVSIEDMLRLARELSADPWFVMPWNADESYLAGFARMVRTGLPAGRHVYVEVGNEVWNQGFAVGRQALKEGKDRHLGGDDRTAAMGRYAQRTAEVMRVWEEAFTDREAALVRVLATQQVDPNTAQTALSFPGIAQHVDALATSAYFGDTLGGTGHTRDDVIARLSASVPVALGQVAANRRVAAAWGKRYIAYEGGEALQLPAEPALLDRLQHDPAQYDIVRRFLAGWRAQAGDTLCILTSVAVPGTSGSWGLAAWEDETPAEAPKMRAVHEALAAG